MERCIQEVTKSLLEGKSTETKCFVSKGITALRVLLKIKNVDQFEFEKKIGSEIGPLKFHLVNF